MGFFDYTSLEDEIVHGLTLIERIIPLLILIGIIYLIHRYHVSIKSFKNEKIIRYVIASLMLIGELSFLTWNYVHSLNGDVRFITTLPLQLCSYAIWGLIFSMATLHKKVYTLVYMFGVVSVLALLFGRSNFSALGLTRVDVSMKKINNKKTISVIEDILKFALTLFLLLNAIIRYDVLNLKIQLF